MTSYKDAGVDIDAGSLAVDRMRKFIKDTYNENVISSVGGFGGMFAMPKYKNPILVSSIDGIGTKLKIAFMLDKHDTVGQDLVNHCVNDILVQGAEPLFFLDYFSTGKLDKDIAVDIVKGFAKACKENNCVLIGGETAEMPDIYKQDEYDLAGCIIGIVEKNDVVDGSKIKVGDKVIGLKSLGLHTNGYSLARKVLLKERELGEDVTELGCTLGEELLKIHMSYLPVVKPILPKVRGMAHITGGGLLENIPRVLPENVDVNIKKSSWGVPGIFRLIQAEGEVSDHEMYRTFNMGIGFVLIVDKKDADSVAEQTQGIVIGEVVDGRGKVILG